MGITKIIGHNKPTFCRKLNYFYYKNIYAIKQQKAIIKPSKSNQSKMKYLSIFIPRVLSNVSKVDIVNTFKEMNIGDVSYIDLKKRINDNKFAYSIVFLKVELMDTITANALCDLIEQNGSTKLYYDETDKNYWELKSYIPPEQRVKVSKEEEESMGQDEESMDEESMDNESMSQDEESIDEEIPELCKQLMKIPSIFTDEVIEMMNKEYEEIEREIARMQEFERYTSSLPYRKLYKLF